MKETAKLEDTVDRKSTILQCVTHGKITVNEFYKEGVRICYHVHSSSPTFIMNRKTMKDIQTAIEEFVPGEVPSAQKILDLQEEVLKQINSL